MVLAIALMLWDCNDEANNGAQQEPQKVVMNQEDSPLLAKGIENFGSENHIHLMELFFGKPKHDTQTIGILVHDGVNDLDVMSPSYINELEKLIKALDAAGIYTQNYLVLSPPPSKNRRSAKPRD